MGEAAEFLEQAIASSTPKCIRWPYAKDGGGSPHVYYKGRVVGANRVACEAVHGPPPPGKNDAARICGEKLCVNPLHLEWRSRRGSVSLKLMTGRNNRGEKHPDALLKPEQVREIRRLMGPSGRGRYDACAEELGIRFGVAAHTIYEIARRNKWAWLAEE